MHKKELLEKLIEAYSDAIKNLPKKNWEIYLAARFLDFGICNYAYYKLQYSVYHEKWIEKYTKKPEPPDYWDYLPGDAKTFVECKRYLKTRLVNLKSEYRFENYHQPSKQKEKWKEKN